jgi:hypothetical protein
MIKYDVFLSHNRKQKPWVREFAAILRNAGLKVFFDEDTIRPGDDIVRAIEQAIEESRHVVLVISPNSVGPSGSKWVAMESAMTVYSDPDANRNALVPVILEPTELSTIPLSIRRLNCINLTNPSTRDKDFLRLIHHLGVPAHVEPHLPSWPSAQLTTRSSLVASLSVVDVVEVQRWGWDGRKLLDELIRLDYETMEGLTPAHEGHTEQWAPVFMDHPDTWRLLVDAPQSIVGYWHFVPLFDEEYALAKQGKLMDSHITTDKVRLFELPGWYNIYFVSICLDFRFRRTIAFQLLFDSLFKLFADLASENVFIREVCTNAYTLSGVSLARSLNLAFYTNHIDHGQIYVSRFDSLLKNDYFNRHKQLREMYDKQLRITGG